MDIQRPGIAGTAGNLFDPRSLTKTPKYPYHEKKKNKFFLDGAGWD
jgi:hypothetical protein